MRHAGRITPTAGRALGMAAALLATGALLAAERLRPLRQRTRPQVRRLARNALMGAACQAVILAGEKPLTQRIAMHNAQAGRGLQHRVGGMAGKVLAYLAMDYLFYGWHVATHKVPFLWRFHRVHHVDPDLDASTAIRFHFADMLVSLPFRLLQVRLAGLDPVLLGRWQAFFTASIAFHHSNLRLPGAWDRRASLVLTTPGMHGIHHSRVAGEMDSNWTSGFSFWDRLHGTYRADVPQETIAIGVEGAAAERDIALLPAILAPLRAAQPPAAGARIT